MNKHNHNVLCLFVKQFLLVEALFKEIMLENNTST